jgi:hypothetical protein
MRVRNCLVILYKIVDFFPRHQIHGEILEAAVKRLSNDERGDLKMLAQGLVLINFSQHESLAKAMFLLGTKRFCLSKGRRASGSLVGNLRPQWLRHLYV